jgi:hypothetical protein
LRCAFYQSDILEPAQALFERRALAGDGNEPGNRFPPFSDDPLSAELHVRKELTQARLRVAHAGYPPTSSAAACSSHDHIIL